ncbi:MAG: S-methyl-5-thioribose kinase [Microthrixaceae bacterium]|jgi:5-methylthioribose kinase|nr:S-methyl-5-thioribose kinase [Microthrixaceae bacterium]
MTATEVGYQVLTAESAASYVASRPELATRIDTGSLARVEEVGDGNLNLVFILTDTAGRGVVLKQALPYMRLVGPDWPMRPDRARLEAEITSVHARVAPGLVPDIYGYDTERFIIAMEDLSDRRVWRGALNDRLRHDGVAEAMGRYVASVAFGTSPLGMDPEDHKRLAASTSNGELCRITEDLVFTEPYVDAGRNGVLPANEPDAAALAADAEMVAAMGLAKWKFMTEGEAIIHGDLHTGSVMVRGSGPDGEPGGQPSTARAIDSEFGFCGPVAFDLGALWANYLIAATRGAALNDVTHQDWCLDLVVRTWTAFEAEFRRLWPTRVDPRVWHEELEEHLLAHWREDAWLFAAAKMARRIVGLAKTSDIETLDPDVRAPAARSVLAVARASVRHREGDSSPESLVALARSLQPS